MVNFFTSDGKRLKTHDGKQIYTNPIGKINVYVTVNESSILRTVPEDFVGQSTSMNLMCGLLTLDSSSTKLLTLLTNLGNSRLRIGGSASLNAIWSPDAETSSCKTPTWSDSLVNKTMIDNIVSFIKKINYKLVFEVNTYVNNPTLYADEINYVYSKAGENLYAVAFGNEPDLWDGFTYSQYKTLWESYRTALQALNSSIPIEGLENSSDETWLQNFIADEHTKISYVTQHYYPLAAEGTGWHTPTLSNLMSETTIRSTVDNFKRYKAYADAYGISLADGETNSVSHGGKAGVSDTMGAVLWAIDHCFSLLELGILHVNFHGLCGENAYSIIDDNCNILPMYYAMLFFHSAAPNGNCVQTFNTSYLNVKSHSVITSDNKLRVSILNKELSENAYVQVKPDGARSTATVLYLDAPSAYATSGLTFGGNAVSDDGTWSAGAAKTLTVYGGVVELTVPAASAVLITFT